MPQTPTREVDGYLRKAYRTLLQQYSPVWHSVSQWQVWRLKTRQALLDHLSMPEDPTLSRKAPMFQEEEAEEKEGIVFQRILFQSELNYWVPGVLLLPKVMDKAPAVLCLCGNGRGYRDVIGMADTEEEEEHCKSMQYDYGLQLAKQGYITFAIEKRGMGELMYEDEWKEFEGMKEQARTLPPGDERKALMHRYCWSSMRSSSGERMEKDQKSIGRTYRGSFVWDAIRAIDYLLARSEVDHDRIGAVGFSGGAAWVNTLAALDERIKASVISSIMMKPCFESDQQRPFSVLGGRSSVVSGLLAPRAVQFQYGEKDDVTPGQPGKGFDDIKTLYQTLGVAHRLDLAVHPGGHSFDLEAAGEFLKRELKSLSE